MIYNIQRGLFGSVWMNEKPFSLSPLTKVCKTAVRGAVCVCLHVSWLPPWPTPARHPLMLHACLRPHTGVNVLLMAVKCAQTSGLLWRGWNNKPLLTPRFVKAVKRQSGTRRFFFLLLKSKACDEVRMLEEMCCQLFIECGFHLFGVCTFQSIQHLYSHITFLLLTNIKLCLKWLFTQK